MKRKRAAALTVAVACILGVAVPGTLAGQDLTTWTFTPVDVPGASITYVRGMTPSGLIVGHYSTGGVMRGFALKDGVITPIQIDVNTGVRGVNPEGDMVGVTAGPIAGQRGFLRTRDGVVTEFRYPGATSTIPEDINSPGDIVGYYSLGGVSHGFLLRKGSFTTIEVPGALWTTVRGINPEGEMVGVYRSLDPDGRERNHGFLLDIHGRFVTVNGPGALGGNASGINPRGDIVGEFYPTGLTVGFLLSGGVSTPFSYPGATTTRPWKITPDGQHIVGFYNDAHGFVLSRKP